VILDQSGAGPAKCSKYVRITNGEAYGLLNGGCKQLLSWKGPSYLSAAGGAGRHISVLWGIRRGV